MLRSQGVQGSQGTLLTRVVFWFAKRRMGRVHLGLRIRAFDPKFLRNSALMDLYSRSKGPVSMHLKELAQLKTALMIGCAL
jgi:hypothetical protein